MSDQPQRLRAYRFTLDPTPGQLSTLAQHAGAARWAYNHALAVKQDAYRRRELQIDELVTIGYTKKQADKIATVKVPSKGQIQRRWNQLKGDETTGVDGICPWWRSVSTYAFQSAWDDADRAWKNFFDSLKGKRAGRRVGAPRFKRKGRARDSFRLHHDVKNPTIRPDGYRRMRMPRIGSVRVQDSTKRLCRAIDRGGRIQSVTVSRGGSHWYAAVLVAEPDITPGRETQGGVDGTTTPGASKAQEKAGTIGIDLGVKHLAALSTGEVVDNPRHLQRSRKRLVKLQRELSRRQGPDKRTGQKASNRWRKTREKLARLQHQIAEQRAAHLHQLTKWLATRYAVIAIEDLSVAGMTSSAKGSAESPGRNVRAKSGLNRAVLDAAPGEFRRQLGYKTIWYGSQLAVCDRWFPSSKACSDCGAVKTKLGLAERVFVCDGCGFTLDRDVNAARNIAAAAIPLGASDGGEPQNARGADISPPALRGGGSWRRSGKAEPSGLVTSGE